MNRTLRLGILIITLLLKNLPLSAQHQVTQYPFFLSDHTYFEVNISYLDYHFSKLQLQPGFQAESVHIPHVGVRLLLYGYRFNKHLSIQATYMRPVLWVQYKNINGDHSSHSVPTNIAGLTFREQFQLRNKWSLYGEAGMGIVTRSGFGFNDSAVITNANYENLLLSGGLQYRWNTRLSSTFGVTWSPAYSKA